MIVVALVGAQLSEDRAPDNGDLSPEDAEKLAERLKPAWEEDAAPAGATPDSAGPSAVPGASPPMTPSEAAFPPPQAEGPAGTAKRIPSAAEKAALRARHARTVLGLAPPPPEPSAGPPTAPPVPQQDAGGSPRAAASVSSAAAGGAPNAFAMAVPPTPLTPPAAPKGEGLLPSVVLADQGSALPPAARPMAPASPPYADPKPFAIGADDDDLVDLNTFKRPSRAPYLLGFLALVGGGYAAFVLLGRAQKNDAPVVEPLPVATTPAPPAAIPPPPLEVPLPAPVTPAAAPPSVPPFVTAPPLASAPPVAPPAAAASAPGKSVPAAAEPSATGKTPAVATSPRAATPAAPRPAPKPAAPPPKPPTPSKPSGGIVRDVPF